MEIYELDESILIILAKETWCRSIKKPNYY